MADLKDKIYALDLDREDWAKRLAGMSQPRFRADQLVQWLWRKHIYDTDEMTNLSKLLRDELQKQIYFQLPTMMKEQRSADGTRKYLWQFRDGQTVESVLMKNNDRLTACVSTQVGCPLQCVFCATGLSGYVRNLSAGEIAAQFLGMEKIIGRDISNIVYMGMGEPFLNTGNVLKSVKMLNNDKMRNLGIRHFTISTSGILPGIIALANSGLGVRLAVSLHAVDDELRGQLMPIGQKYPVSELREAMGEYQKITGDRITIEYVLFGDVNDTVEHARALVRYLKGLHTFINLIPFNSVDDRFKKPTAEAVLKFRKILDTAGFETEIRQEHGADIGAACGQLRRKTMSGDAVRLDPKPDFKPSVLAIEAKKFAKPRKASNVAKPQKSEKATSTNKRQTAQSGGDIAVKHGVRGLRKSNDILGCVNKNDKRSEKKPYGKTNSDFAPQGRKPVEKPDSARKHKKTDEPKKERYRSGKMKDERPSYKEQSGEKIPEREAKWFEGAVKPRRPRSKKPSAPGAAKTSMTGAKRRSKPKAKPRTKKK